MNFQLTRVEAPTMDEALAKVRAELGSDAMIVSTRTFRRGGVLGVGGHEVVEVYAADTRSRIENIKRESSNRSRLAESPTASDPNRSAADDASVRSSRKQALPGKGFLGGGPAQSGEELRAFSEAIGQIRQDIQELVSRTGESRHAHPLLRECYETMVSREVDPRVAELIISEISQLRLPSGYPEPSRVRALVRNQLAKLFITTPPYEDRKRPRLVVLVGPTGVGKTTTIAKLAAKAKINEGRRVGLITIDTFRIAAVDQLEKYAEIIGLPLLVATNPPELKAAVDAFREQKMDLVFIDSAGRSHRDELKMAELREFLAVTPEAEVHLVVSTTTHGKTILSIATRFAGIGFDKLILTKVDETISFGSLVNTLISIGRPVSFVTDGQNVPDDIVPSDPERLADLVLKTNAL